MDATIISLAAIAVVVSSVVVPMIAGTEEPLLTTVCAVAYPVLDVLVLSGLVRVLVGGGRWHTSLGLVVLAMLFMLTADLAYNVIALNGDAVDPQLDRGAVPRVRRAGGRRRDRTRGLDRGRPGAGAARRPDPGSTRGTCGGGLTAPVALAVRTWSEVDAGARLLAVASIAVILLVLWRVVLLFQTVARSPASWRRWPGSTR